MFSLTYNIQLILKLKLITLCFFNVKKTFDHAIINQLLTILTNLNLLIRLKK